MELLHSIFDFLLHIDRYLVDIINSYQGYTYLLIFLLIFAETGLVVTPFLPGDSVLFALGASLALPGSQLSLPLMLACLIAAAILGDFVNYELGKYIGVKVFREDSKIFKPAYLVKTQQFYEKYGTKTIIYARFVPLVRTFAPFVAGLSRMPYRVFGKYNIIGGTLWVSLFLLVGYFFGQFSFIQRHFSLIIIAIIGISLLPALLEIWRNRNNT